MVLFFKKLKLFRRQKFLRSKFTFLYNLLGPTNDKIFHNVEFDSANIFYNSFLFNKSSDI